MSDTIAFALRAEFEGTTPVAGDDGATIEIPTYQGGLLAVDNSDFDVAAALEAGAGAIVVWSDDTQLAGILAAYPPLKEIATPAGATPVSKYERRTLEDLRNIASLRDIDGAGSASKVTLVAALDAFDAAQRGGDQETVAAIADDPKGATPAEPATPPAKTNRSKGANA